MNEIQEIKDLFEDRDEIIRALTIKIKRLFRDKLKPIEGFNYELEDIHVHSDSKYVQLRIIKTIDILVREPFFINFGDEQLKPADQIKQINKEAKQWAEGEL